MTTPLAAWLPPLPGGVAADKPALIDGGSGHTLSHGTLALRASRVATWLCGLGLVPGDGIAMLLENRAELIELALGAEWAGLYYTPIGTQLTPGEIGYLLRDCGARVFVASQKMLDGPGAGLALPPGLTRVRIDGPPDGPLDDATDNVIDDAIDGWLSYEAALATVPVNALAAAWAQLAQRPLGRDLLYSSGTTGRPKGVKRPLPPRLPAGQVPPEIDSWRQLYGFGADTVYLSPAPLYHAAPLRYTLRVIALGGTAVVMPKFDAEQALALIERHRVSHSQWVPTMFGRMLRLPEHVRTRHDLSSLRVAIHAAAPCPVEVKRAMLDWWGDVVHEYYAGSEGVGITVAGPQEWRARPGTVGRALGCGVHIVGEDGAELPHGEIGAIYFSGMPGASYLNDPDKTRGLYNDRGWATYGDIGHLDADGYLFLSDRRADLILSGGVNVYPKEIEDALAPHPDVDDVGVVGVPDADLGEVPKAVVRLRPGLVADAARAEALLAYLQDRLGRIKMPRSVVFDADLPRMDNGKLLRRVIKERYRDRPAAGFALRSEREG
ncbi:AMP-binding protein [Pseudorhodoferax sp. Leaf274]|uniref:AMP-binding protein n=1 Tax=Pseudorhodoferax sp. Leaf274 TaxID=1736318 RepID=UPI00070248E1|nr:AMP-binding protein [Pseudorhodoferax sp. Leaf274]KQP35702.1 acyl-CoA synthetase [Pseudorhodoferax sp. Leaf274]